MSSWRLVRATVDSVLDGVEDAREGIGDAVGVDGFKSVLEGVTAVGPAGGLVSDVMARLSAAEYERVNGVLDRITAGTVGVGVAADAYDIANNHEMLPTIQQKMFESAENGDFSWWFGEGA